MPTGVILPVEGTPMDFRLMKTLGRDIDCLLYTSKGIYFVPYFHPDYPSRLREIPSPPYALYIKGKLPDDDRPSVAIVGARQCTSYGEQMAIAYGLSLIHI